jgi:PAS domain-containing protein
MLPSAMSTHWDEASLTLALVEAQLGSLVDLLPVAVLVATSGGQIFRANEVAVELLASQAPLVGQSASAALEAACRKKPLRVRLRWLRHEGDVLRLYVVHEAAGQESRGAEVSRQNWLGKPWICTWCDMPRRARPIRRSGLTIGTDRSRRKGRSASGE